MNLEFGKNLKRLRLERNMTQENLAAVLGLSTQAVSRYETEAAYPDIELLPLIAGYFGVSVDALLGVSDTMRERRRDLYNDELNRTTDPTARLAILRRWHTEFPDSWEVVSSMVYEMAPHPEHRREWRALAEDALARCPESLWRENILLEYVRYEPDDALALSAIDRYASVYDISRTALLAMRARQTGDTALSRRLDHKELIDRLNQSLRSLAARDPDLSTAIGNINAALAFLDALTGNPDRTAPDLWAGTKLFLLGALANDLFMRALPAEGEAASAGECTDGASDDIEAGFTAAETVAALIENLLSLPDGTRLSYGTPRLSALDATTERTVFFRHTTSSGAVAHSFMLNFHYITPIAPVNPTNQHVVWDMEGYTRDMLFPDHSIAPMNASSGNGFSRVAAIPAHAARLRALVDRMERAVCLSNLDNLLVYLRRQALRTDDFMQGVEAVTTLCVPSVGELCILGDRGAEDGAASISDIMGRIRRAEQTRVTRLVSMDRSARLVPPTPAVVEAVMALDPANAEAEVVLADGPCRLADLL